MPILTSISSASPAVCTLAAHGLVTGQKLQFPVVPATGIAANTDYWVRWASANTFQLSSVNTGAQVTITIASPGVITWAGHGLSANDQLFFGTNGALPTGITASNNNVVVPTYYFVKTVLDANTFTISTTSGGSVINTSGSQSGTHIANKHIPVNTSGSGSNSVCYSYDSSISINPNWITSTSYVVNQIVNVDVLVYRCQTAHTSGTFSTDLASGYWILQPDIVIGDSMVTVRTVKLATQITLTGMQAGSDIVILEAGTSNEYVNIDQNAGTTYQFNTLKSGSIDIGVFKQGYVPFYIRNYAIPDTPMSLPVVQVVDRNYS